MCKTKIPLIHPSSDFEQGSRLFYLESVAIRERRNLVLRQVMVHHRPKKTLQQLELPKVVANELILPLYK